MKQLACGHVGLDCECVVNAATEEDVMKKAIEHMWEYHAIKQEEMTSIQPRLAIILEIRQYMVLFLE